MFIIAIDRLVFILNLLLLFFNVTLQPFWFFPKPLFFHVHVLNLHWFLGNFLSVVMFVNLVCIAIWILKKLLSGNTTVICAYFTLLVDVSILSDQLTCVHKIKHSSLKNWSICVRFNIFMFCQVFCPYFSYFFSSISK